MYTRVWTMRHLLKTSEPNIRETEMEKLNRTGRAVQKNKFLFGVRARVHDRTRNELDGVSVPTKGRQTKLSKYGGCVLVSLLTPLLFFLSTFPFFLISLAVFTLLSLYNRTLVRPICSFEPRIHSEYCEKIVKLKIKQKQRIFTMYATPSVVTESLLSIVQFVSWSGC